MAELGQLLLGIVLAWAGGELFVRGSVRLAYAWGIAPAIVGLTIAAFATSSPEAAVSAIAAAEGRPTVALGAALGSNIVNLGLILALPLLILGGRESSSRHAHGYLMALISPAIFAAVAYDGELGQVDAAILFAVFAAWVVITAITARGSRSGGPQERPGAAAAVFGLIVGLAVLVAAAHFIVTGATTIAENFAVPPFLIGATIVALGTSVPEIATVIIATVRGHQDVGVSALWGSNVFNTLFVIPIAAAIHPMADIWAMSLPALIVGFFVVLITWPYGAARLGRGRAILLLAAYGAYVWSAAEGFL
ncbi:MAG: sodium:calcium antiporter [Alphaproteobacteria bacterium]|nr:sodium:calcium antiporter [Alphaproteobacteria bacterium]